MKKSTYNTIKYWDNELIYRFIKPELEQVFNHFKTYNIDSLSYIDVGGNVGKFYDEISKRHTVNRCEIVEASKMLCEYMVDKYRNNSNVIIHNFGLSDKEGTFYFGDEQIRWFENTGEDGTGNKDVNLGLSASHFVDHDNTDYDGATKFYNGTYFLENFNSTSPQDIKFIKVDTENRDIQIVSSMKNYFINHNISPIILFENNYRYFLSLGEAQSLIDDLCDKVGYKPVDLSGPHENIFLLPI